jgi:iron complex transport system ATP-binding protein
MSSAFIPVSASLSAPTTPPLLELKGATVVKGVRRILDDLRMTIQEGEHVALLGPNGSGKSSLIKLITRQHYPLVSPSGEPVMRLFGEVRWDVATLRSLLGIVSADQHQAFIGGASAGAMLAREVVLSGFFGGIGLASHHHLTSEMADRAHESLKMMEASHLAEKPMEEMSTGEARRVLIARALAPDPRALLLDEPTTGLDLPTTHRFLETIRGIIAHGKTVLLVTHHTEEIVPEIERVILLRKGTVFQDGPKEAVLTSQILSEVFDAPIVVKRAQVPGYYEARVGEYRNS